MRTGAESVTSRGWLVGPPGRRHRVELGLDIVGFQHPWTIFADDMPVAHLPLLFTGGRWHAAFRIDGRTVVIRARITSRRFLLTWTWAFEYSLVFDGEDLGPPAGVDGPPDRPAVGSPRRRDRRSVVTAGLSVVGGFAVGLLVPFAGSNWRGPGLVLTVALLIVLGVVTIPIAVAQVLRRQAYDRTWWVLRFLLPFDVGIVVGIVCSSVLASGSGSDQAQSLVLIVLLVPMAVISIVFGVLGCVDLWTQRRAEDESPYIILATWCTTLGFFAVGLGFFGLAARFVRGDRYGTGIEGILLLGGLAIVCFGALAMKFDRRRSRGRAPGGSDG